MADTTKYLPATTLHAQFGRLAERNTCTLLNCGPGNTPEKILRMRWFVSADPASASCLCVHGVLMACERAWSHVRSNHPRFASRISVPDAAPWSMFAAGRAAFAHSLHYRTEDATPEELAWCENSLRMKSAHKLARFERLVQETGHFKIKDLHSHERRVQMYIHFWSGEREEQRRHAIHINSSSRCDDSGHLSVRGLKRTAPHTLRTRNRRAAVKACSQARHRADLP